jgi:hypothetical protein
MLSGSGGLQPVAAKADPPDLPAGLIVPSGRRVERRGELRQPWLILTEGPENNLSLAHILLSTQSAANQQQTFSYRL